MSLQWVAQHFEKLQVILIVVAIIVGFLTMRSRENGSNFKVREGDRPDLDRLKNGPSLADAKIDRRQTPPPKPLALPGIQMHGQPHEVLGIAEEATEAEVMKAYKDAIKQYHPDRIQGQAQEQMQFYQEASAQINQAKEKMLLKLKYKK